MNAFLITGVGFSTNNSTAALDGGIANTVYQTSAAIVGIGLGVVCSDLDKVILRMHIVAVASLAALVALCAVVSHGDRDVAGLTTSMLGVMALLGGSLCVNLLDCSPSRIRFSPDVAQLGWGFCRLCCSGQLMRLRFQRT